MRARAALLAAALALALAAPARAGLALTASTPLSPRLTELTMTTPSLAEPTKVRVLLPAGYAEHPERRYPVLLLIHGGFDTYASWTDKGAAEAITADAPAIVVMPDDGQGGWCTDWHNGGSGGPPKWETFHIRELLPWVDSTYRTIPGRAGRGVAGLSTGGFCTMTYATRHPDEFSFAAAFSGALDIVGNVPVAPVIYAEALADGRRFDGAFGERLTHTSLWRAHNPVDLAENARGLKLHVLTGNGFAGPYEQRPTFDPVEHQVREMSLTFSRRLRALGIAHELDDYGGGTHSWPYWQRDLRQVLPSFLATVAAAPRPPARVTFSAWEPAYEAYGWEVRIARRGLERTRLTGAGADGFTLEGRGRGTVVTPPLFSPGESVTVRAGAAAPAVVRASSEGRLTVAVPLGARVRVER